MSCAGEKYMRAPGSFAVLARSRAITWSIDSPRSFSGFSAMNIAALLAPRPPVKPITLSTAGSFSTTVM